MWAFQPEILDYLRGIAEKYGLRRYVRFGQHVDRAQWDDAESRWHVFTKDGQEYIAQFLISGAGALHIPSVPDVDGLFEFVRGGGAAFHSAQWDHSVDIAHKRVAVIGTGASAIRSSRKSSSRWRNFSCINAPRHGSCRGPITRFRRACKGVRHDPGHSCVAASTHLLDPRVGGFRDDPAAGDFETR